jgi:CysZ protein
MKSHSFQGAQYLNKGWKLVRLPGIRKYVYIPLLINFVLLSLAAIYAFDLISDWYTSLPIWLESKVNAESWYLSWPAEALQWLVTSMDWLLWPIIVLSVLITVFFIFGFVANWIAAPFNGLLSEAVERHLAGENYQATEFSWVDFFKDIPRLVAREWKKLAYYLPRAIGCLLLFLTPISPIVPIIWFLFNGWMSAIQYIDYPEDNHRRSFKQTLYNLSNYRRGPFGFGIVVMLFTMIPVLNILVMPVAVAGATNLWYDHYRHYK